MKKQVEIRITIPDIAYNYIGDFIKGLSLYINKFFITYNNKGGYYILHINFECITIYKEKLINNKIKSINNIINDEIKEKLRLYEIYSN